MVKKILIVVQQPTSDLGRIGLILRDRGYQLDIRCPSISEELPNTMDDHDGVVIFGGPMSANDSETLPFIRTELDWIPIAIESDKPFLGICLGAQLLARALGATVAPDPDGMTEVGYFPIVPTPAGRDYFGSLRYVYHWHREGFELPNQAVKLVSGEIFENQAFRYGSNAYGLQFHPEITREIIERWTTQASQMLTLPGAQSREEQIQKHSLCDRAYENWLKAFLPLWLGDALSVQLAYA